MSPIDHMKDEAPIREIEEAYDKALNRGDIQTLVSFFAPDTTMSVDPPWRRTKPSAGKRQLRGSDPS